MTDARVAAELRRTSGARRRPRSHAPRDAMRRRLYWPFLAPALLFFVAFLAAPIIYTLWLSFHSWRGVGPVKANGIANYQILLQDETFKLAFRNTFLITIGVGAVVFIVSFALTMVLREMAGRKFARAVIFFPNIVAPVVLAILWGFLFRSDGLVNQVLGSMGLEQPRWLASDNVFLMICLALVWIHTGFYTTILMSAVDNIPAYFYEDALLAGANAWQRFRYVTLPLSWDVVSVAILLWTISSLKIFEFIYAFAGAAGDLPPTNTWNSALFVYAQTFGGRTAVSQFGYASAASVATLVPAALLVLLLLRVFRRRDPIQF